MPGLNPMQFFPEVFVVKLAVITSLYKSLRYGTPLVLILLNYSWLIQGLRVSI